MNKNPYTVLGVHENAADEEIKKAYRELVKKYHPDKYAGSDLAELANEKMQEINAAYEEIEKMRKNGSSSSSYHSSYAGGSTGYSGNTSGNRYADVRNAINVRNFAAALAQLNAVPEYDRGAEWHYLMGLVLVGTGRLFDGRVHLENACRMDPASAEYRAARDRAAGVSFGGYSSPGTSYGNGCGCSSCDCLTCLCADSCCECFGGDLVPCC